MWSDKALWTGFFEGTDGLRMVKEFWVNRKTSISPWQQISNTLGEGTELLLAFPGTRPTELTYSPKPSKGNARSDQQLVDVWETPGS